MIEIFRIENKDDARYLESLIAKFHDKVQGLRYPLVWSIQNITVASTQRHNNVVLAAWDEERGDYTGYLWCAIHPNGEAYIYQAYSSTPECGRALEASLERYCKNAGSKLIDCLVTLQPGEGMQLLHSIRRFDYLAKRHGFVPQSVWLTKPVLRGH